ncbi:MAG: hypothetical protein ACHQ7M_09515, partial [Chloroflexota bacterium]
MAFAAPQGTPQGHELAAVAQRFLPALPQLLQLGAPAGKRKSGRFLSRAGCTRVRLAGRQRHQAEVLQ